VVGGHLSSPVPWRGCRRTVRLMTTSLWQDMAEPVHTDPFPEHGRFDVVVVGAGLTGLACAAMLARPGLSVAVLEARSIGDVTTGRSTGKVSLLQGGVLSGIRRSHSDNVLRAYVEGNREAQTWLLGFLSQHDIPVEHRDAFTYATTPEGADRLDDEAAACRAAGLDIELVDGIGLPFSTSGAIRLADQAQIDPVAALHALAAEVRARGGLIVQGTRVTQVHTGEPTRVVTARGELAAGHVVLATGIPFLDRGLYFAKVQPSRSYLQAFRVGSPLPRGMFISLDPRSRSLRTANVAGEERLLVGGGGHVVGRESDTRSRVEELEAWAAHWFPGVERTHAWSAQDYRSANMTPFVGWMPRTGHKVALATGYNKWGLTNAVAAALSIRADLLEEELPWAQVLHHRVTKPPAVASGIAMNAEVGGHLVADWVETELHPLPEAAPDEGDGAVGRVGAQPVAVSRVRGEVCRLSAVCPHLGGILSWNAAERSWDCPLHGSRFDHRGRLLEGPATTDLEPAKPPGVAAESA